MSHGLCLGQPRRGLSQSSVSPLTHSPSSCNAVLLEQVVQGIRACLHWLCALDFPELDQDEGVWGSGAFKVTRVAAGRVGCRRGARLWGPRQCLC